MAKKYERWYGALMKRAVGRTVDGYVERHHVLPRSMGGSDGPSNIVALTYREHFLAHWLLTKFTTGADRRKMQHALYRMSGQFGGRVVASWRYDVARRAQREAKLGTKQSPEVIAKRAAAMRGNRNAVGVKLSPDQIEVRRLRSKGNKHSLGFKHRDETLVKRSAATKSVWESYTDEQKAARAAKVSAGAARTRANKGPAPWVILGMSHRTWYRRGKPQPSAMGGDNR